VQKNRRRRRRRKGMRRGRKLEASFDFFRLKVKYNNMKNYY
jgi:hypothetical protein